MESPPDEKPEEESGVGQRTVAVWNSSRKDLSSSSSTVGNRRNHEGKRGRRSSWPEIEISWSNEMMPMPSLSLDTIFAEF